jgi:hypothetical protein
MNGEIVRIAGCACVLMLLSACATQPNIQPKEYLDEQTAATITTVAEPWVFNREGAPAQLDFVHLYALDVNRMGSHQLYLVVLKHWAAPDLVGERAPVLEIQLPNATLLKLEALADSARDLGIGQPLDTTAPKGAKSWCYPINAAQLTSISRSGDARIALIGGETRASYVVWSDAHAAFAELAATAN